MTARTTSTKLMSLGLHILPTRYGEVPQATEAGMRYFLIGALFSVFLIELSEIRTPSEKSGLPRSAEHSERRSPSSRSRAPNRDAFFDGTALSDGRRHHETRFEVLLSKPDGTRVTSPRGWQPSCRDERQVWHSTPCRRRGRSRAEFRPRPPASRVDRGGPGRVRAAVRDPRTEFAPPCVGASSPQRRWRSG